MPEGSVHGHSVSWSIEAGFAYTVATGKLFCPMDEFHRRAEALLGRPIFTHEFADMATWEALRNAFEAEALVAMPS
jgi:hypothetical protein